MFTPVTHYAYDDKGRLKSSWTDPDYDEYDRALVDVYKDWLADLHTCGRPMSESLRVNDRDDPDYVVGTRICTACMELEITRAQRAKSDEAMREKGINPDSWRLDHLELRSDD